MSGATRSHRVTSPAGPLVAVCGLGSRVEARIADGLRGAGRLVRLTGAAELDDYLSASPADLDVLIVPAPDLGEWDSLCVIRRVVRERPRTAVLVWCRYGAEFSSDLRALAAAGVHQFVFDGRSDSGVALRAAVSSARAQCAADWLLDQMQPLFPPRVHPVIEAALSHPDRITSVPELAAALGVHRKTLFNWCRATGLSGPAELLAWCRLCLVAYHLEFTGCTVEAIALGLSYPSDTALRNSLRRYTGQRATEIRAGSGVHGVVRQLAERLNGDPRPTLHLV